MNKKKMFSFTLFLIGLSVFAYPLISRTYFDYQHRLEVEKVEGNIQNNAKLKDKYIEQQKYNQRNDSENEEIEVGEVTFAEREHIASSEISNEKLIGTLSIPKIDLNYPIYDGATDENLYQGVARIEGTSYPVGGTDTHSVIAGHNGLVGKTYFSDIKKLESGDVIEIQNANEQLYYEVYETNIIEPTEVEALGVIPNQDTLTLLTCTYPPPGTHRYLVYAKRAYPNSNIENQMEKDSEIQNKHDKQNKIQLFFLRYGKLFLLFLFASVIIFIFLKPSKKK